MMTLNDLCAHLLPPDEHLKFKTLIINEAHFTLVATMMAPQSTCPDCHQPTDRVHSRYRRTLGDLPWATTPIELLASIISRANLATENLALRQQLSVLEHTVKRPKLRLRDGLVT